MNRKETALIRVWKLWALFFLDVSSFLLLLFFSCLSFPVLSFGSKTRLINKIHYCCVEVMNSMIVAEFFVVTYTVSSTSVPPSLPFHVISSCLPLSLLDSMVSASGSLMTSLMTSLICHSSFLSDSFTDTDLLFFAWIPLDVQSETRSESSLLSFPVRM